MSTNSDRCIHVPIDSRLGISAMWLASLILIVIDSLDLDPSYLGLWAIFLAIAAASWTSIAMQTHSRRVMLEVISWEHRQQGMFFTDGGELALLKE